MASLLERNKKPRPTKMRLDEPVWEIASLFPMQGHWSEGEYLALEANAGNRMIELADGRLEILPMPNMVHQDILDFILTLLKAYVTAHGLGRVYFREPDLVFLRSHRIKDKTKPPEGADLVMEIVSPGKDARERDFKDKREDYAKAKIPEYWIIDPKEKKIIVLTLSGKSYKVHGVFKPGEDATSKLLKGFKVAVGAVFAAGEAAK